MKTSSNTDITPVVLCADEKYGCYAPAVLRSLTDKARSGKQYHIIVLDCGISKASLAQLDRIMAGAENFSLQIENIEPWLEKYKNNFTETGYLTKAMYGRWLIPEICADYDKAIYIEIDCIFNRDIAELFALDIGDNYVAAVPDALTETWRAANSEEKRFCADILGLAPDDLYIFSGFLVFNIAAWRELTLAEKCIAFLMANKTRFPDQDAINAVCKGKIHYLPQIWCCTALDELVEQRFKAVSVAADKFKTVKCLIDEWRAAFHSPLDSVIHYNGPLKPWMPQAELKMPVSGYWQFVAHNLFPRALVREEYRPLVSVIVPFFNNEIELPRCLSALSGQTYQNIEMLLIDDVSTDGSLKIAEQFARKDSRIRILNKAFVPPITKKMKEAGARNLGLDCARGKYIMFCDADDYYELNMAEVMVNAMEKNPEAELASCSVKVHQLGWQDDRLEGSFRIVKSELLDFTQRLKAREPIPLWNKIFLRRLFEDYQIRAYTLPERSPDQNIAAKYFSVCNKIYHVKDRLYNYITRDNSITGQTGKDLSLIFLCDLEHVGEAASFCNKNGVWKNNAEYFKKLVGNLIPQYAAGKHSQSADSAVVTYPNENIVKTYCLLGVPILKLKKKQNANLYYFMGVRLAKIKRSFKNIKYYFLGVKVFNVKTLRR